MNHHLVFPLLILCHCSNKQFLNSAIILVSLNYTYTLDGYSFVTRVLYCCLCATNKFSIAVCFWTILFQLQVQCKEYKHSSCAERRLLNDIRYLGCSVPQTAICSWFPDRLCHLVPLFAAGYICISIWLFKGCSLPPSLWISF